MQLNKTQLLDTLEHRVEQHISLSINHFQNLPESVLLKPSATGGWSIVQCLEHLNSYGRYYLPAIEKRLRSQKEDLTQAKVRQSWLGKYFKELMDPKTGTKKFKAFKGHVPSADLDPHRVVAEFIQQQETLLKLIHESRKKNMNKVRIPISILKIIRLNVADTLQFIIAHNERHIKQAQRNL